LRGKLKSTKLAGKVVFDGQAGRARGSSTQADLAGDLKLGEEDGGVMKVKFKHQLELEIKP
jgi:hypothetical protein